jgi:uncharacterized membrane protein
MRSACPAHILLLNLIILIIFNEEYMLLRSAFTPTSYYSYFILLQTRYSPQHPHSVTDQVSDPYKITGKIIFLYFNSYFFIQLVKAILVTGREGP